MGHCKNVWGGSVVSLNEYKKNMKMIVQILSQLFPSATLIFATTTPVVDERCKRDFQRFNQDVCKYNACAAEIMKDNSVKVCDLYTIGTAVKDQLVDSVHYTPTGYQLLGNEIVRFIMEIIKNGDEKSA